MRYDKDQILAIVAKFNTEATATVRAAVEEHMNTAEALGSGHELAFSSVEMMRLVEAAALAVMDQLKPAGLTCVGIWYAASHTVATPVGMSVQAEATIREIEGSTVRFDVKVLDDEGLIGMADHHRKVLDEGLFRERLKMKRTRIKQA